MGRHSAPDSDEEELSESAVITTSVVVSGRHADAEAAPAAETAPVVAVAPAESPAESAPPVAAPATDVPPSAAPSKAAVDAHAGTRGDLHLLRESRSLRARCAAAVIVPFVIFTILLIALGRTDIYLIWLWIPTVLAGVLVGAFLDNAHRKLRIAASTDAVSGSVDDD